MTSLLPPIFSSLPDIFARDRSTNFHLTLVKQRHRLLREGDRSPLIDWTNVRFRNFHINGNADSTCCKTRPWRNSWPIVIVRFYSRPVGRPGVCSSIGARPQLEIDCPSYRLTTKLLNSRDDHAKKKRKEKKERGEKRKYGDVERRGGKILKGILFSWIEKIRSWKLLC